MHLSILISTYNGENDVGSLLDSIARLDRDGLAVQVILRDDGSRDSTCRVIEQQYGWVTLLRSTGSTLGYGKSINAALPRATGSLLCVLNQDTILHRGFLRSAVEVMNRYPQACGINTNMIMPWVMPLPQFMKISEPGRLAFEYQLTREGLARYVAVEPAPRPTNFLSGGAFVVRRSVLSAANALFDPRIDMYCEDTELSLRLQGQGRRLIFSPGTLVYHNQRPPPADIRKALAKSCQVTINRFAVYARGCSPRNFSRHYPLLLTGIVKKCGYLNLDRRNSKACVAGALVVAHLFAMLYPYWLIRSFLNNADTEFPLEVLTSPGSVVDSAPRPMP